MNPTTKIPFMSLSALLELFLVSYTQMIAKYSIEYYTIIASKASGRDCTNNNELLHKIGVLQRYAMHLFVFTRELYNRFDGAVSKTVVPRETDNKVEGSSPNKSFFIFFCFRKYAENFS